ncbi:MAG TPA: tripartite tricarboxylate transporter substrate binding protein [Casimicrobiaceae bacterium]|jgi:tripartite-type tricarboxylate transporter receptor subunit TctC|nr:tripartite tricarboxylate transporter substrate binding protein [Casimicrobiaceae bacterium]
MSVARTRVLALALCALVVPLAAYGQAWPTKPVRLISPFAAGGGTDAFARPLAAVLSQQLGQQFVVDNRAGAGGTIGADIAAKSPPDGYTFLVGAVHHTIAVSVYSKLPYDLEKDLVPVTMVAMVPSVIVVHPKVPIHSVAELIAYAKANPGKLNFASAGNGTSHQLNAELFKVKTGTQMNHVPYKGAGPAMQDLLAGQVDLMFDGMGTSAPQIRGQRLRPLAVTTAARAPAFPDIPTLQESGVPDYDVTTWYALWAPAGTPPEIIAKMQQEVAKALATPQLREVWAQNAATGGGNPPPEFAAFVKREISRWADVAKASGARID